MPIAYRLSVPVHLFIVFAVAAVSDGGNPVFVAKVPVDGRIHAVLESDFGRPSEFVADFGGVDGITPVVSRAIL